MALTITDECINCGACDPECPTGAIADGPTVFVIDPNLCTECVGLHGEPACAAVCPVDCCIPDPNHAEPEPVLFEKFISVLADAPAAKSRGPVGPENSRFRAPGAGTPEEGKSISFGELMAQAAEAARALRQQDDARSQRVAHSRAAAKVSPTAFEELLADATTAELESIDPTDFIDRGGEGGLHASICRHFAARPARKFPSTWRTGSARTFLLSILDAWPQAPDSACETIQELLNLKAMDFKKPLPDLGSLRGWILRRGVLVEGWGGASVRFRALLLGPEFFSDQEIPMVVKALLGDTPRQSHWEDRAVWDELRHRDHRIADALDQLLRGAASGLEVARVHGLHRVGRTVGVCLPSTGESFPSLYEWGPWDPMNPEDPEEEAKSLLRQLPIATVKKKKGRVRAKKYNPYNNAGTEWQLTFFVEAGVARVEYICLASSDGNWEERVELADFEQAVEYARGRAEEYQTEGE